MRIRMTDRSCSSAKRETSVKVRVERDHDQALFAGVLENPDIAGGREADVANVNRFDCGGAEMHSG